MKEACFSRLASTGILRRRLPVAAKTALAIAGKMPTFSSTYKIELMNLVSPSEAI